MRSSTAPPAPPETSHRRIITAKQTSNLQHIFPGQRRNLTYNRPRSRVSRCRHRLLLDPSHMGPEPAPPSPRPLPPELLCPSARSLSPSATAVCCVTTTVRSSSLTRMTLEARQFIRRFLLPDGEALSQILATIVEMAASVPKSAAQSCPWPGASGLAPKRGTQTAALGPQG